MEHKKHRRLINFLSVEFLTSINRLTSRVNAHVCVCACSCTSIFLRTNLRFRNNSEDILQYSHDHNEIVTGDCNPSSSYWLFRERGEQTPQSSQ